MIALVAVLLALGALLFTLAIRRNDLPEAASVSPTAHLEEKRGAVYDNFRDLQFEYRVGKLSDADYQEAKAVLQRELANLNAEIERLGGAKTAAPATQVKPVPAMGTVCPKCGAKFAQPLRFCGECAAPMAKGGAA